MEMSPQAQRAGHRRPARVCSGAKQSVRVRIVVAVALIVCVCLVLAAAAAALLRVPCAQRATLPAQSTEKPAFPVDAVMLWVDTNDEWRAARDAAAKRVASDPLLASNSNNFEASRLMPQAEGREKEYAPEISYAVLSAARNMPWLSRILVVVADGQDVSWLADVRSRVSPKRVKIIRHSEFIPHDLLPVFSACLIEAHLDLISDLSEHFVLFSDDMFVLKHVTPSAFFQADGKPIVRAVHEWQESVFMASALCLGYACASAAHAYARSVHNMVKDLAEHIVPRSRSTRVVPLLDFHHPRSCTKTMFQKAREQLATRPDRPYAISLRAPLRPKRGCTATIAARTLALINGDAVLPPLREQLRPQTHYDPGSLTSHKKTLRILRRKVPDAHIPHLLCVNGVPRRRDATCLTNYLSALQSFFRGTNEFKGGALRAGEERPRQER